MCARVHDHQALRICKSSDQVIKLHGRRLYTGGYIYVKDKLVEEVIHWKCEKHYTTSCPAIAITSTPDLESNLNILMGDRELEHNHPPSLTTDISDFKKIEYGAENVKSNSQDIDQFLLQKKRNSKFETETASRIIALSVMDMEIESESRSDEGAPTSDSTNIAGPTLPRLIGSNRLCLDGHVYGIRRRRYGRLYWNCIKWRTAGCTATAITSDPLVSKTLTVHRGLGESKHTHSISLSEVEAAEKMAKLGPKKRKGSKNPVVMISQQPRRQCASASKRLPKISKVAAERRPSLSINEQVGSSTRLIGVRLCIDNYVYYRSSCTTGRVYWKCRRFEQEGCLGRIVTSFLSGGKFTTLKAHDASTHNHLPYLEDVTESEELAKVPRRGRKPNHLKTVNTSLAQEHNRSSSFVSSEKIVANDETESDGLPVLSSRGIIMPKRIQGLKGDGMLHDPRKYHIFLSTFSKMPIFDRKNVVEALKSIYSSMNGCVMNYATVLENREKIERDLKNLKEHPEIMVDPSSSCDVTTEQDEEATENVEDGEMEQIMELDTYTDEMVLAVDTTELQENSCIQQEWNIPTIPSASTEAPGMDENSPESCVHDKENFKIIPSVSVNVPGVDDGPPRSATPFVDLTNDEIEATQFSTVIDLTDDCDVKQECVIDNDPMLKGVDFFKIEEKSVSIFPKNPESHVVQGTESSSLCLNPPNARTTHCRSQNQSTTATNIEETLNNPYTSQIFNIYVRNFDRNEPPLHGNVQIPLIINLPKLRDDGTSHIEQFHAEMQVNG